MMDLVPIRTPGMLEADPPVPFRSRPLSESKAEAVECADPRRCSGAQPTSPPQLERHGLTSADSESVERIETTSSEARGTTKWELRCSRRTGEGGPSGLGLDGS